MKRLFFVFLAVLAGVFFFNCLAVEAGTYQGGALSPDKRIIEARDKKIVSPQKVWTWLSSWVVVRKQPKEDGGRRFAPPYTLEYSFRTKWFEETTWLEYSYMIWRQPLDDYNDRGIEKVEKWIWKNFKYAAIVRYIEKRAANFYIVVYRRNNQKKRDIPKISGYQLFNVSPQISDEAIFFNIPIKDVDPFNRSIGLQPMKFLIKDIFLLNPSFFLQPTELEYVFIPYDFFARKFIYEHQDIKRLAHKQGDPMIIKIKDDGIEVGFKKQTTIPEG